MAFVGAGHCETIKQVEEGDIVVLRRGTKSIVAVGRAKKRDGRIYGCRDKQWLEDFDGWDLSAYCYVEWHKRLKPPIPIRGLARWPIAHVGTGNSKVRRCADRILKEIPVHEPKPEPEPTQEVGFEEMSEYLVRKGLCSKVAVDLIPRLRQIRGLANRYYEFGYLHWDEVKEHEIRTFLIVPLLLALGWDERQIKIELSPSKLEVAAGRGSIDIACFSSDYQPGNGRANRENCKLIIESKRFSSGITRKAPEQARKYAEDLPTNCEVVFASNGYCYKAFTRNGAERFSEQPSAYLNLRTPKYKYPLDPSIGGALKVLELLLPGSQA